MEREEDSGRVREAEADSILGNFSGLCLCVGEGTTPNA